MEKDFQKFAKDGALAALRYQQEIEERAFIKGGNNLRAPAQRFIDFVEKKSSRDLPVSSYIPGLTSAAMDDVLPPEIFSALRVRDHDGIRIRAITISMHRSARRVIIPVG